MHQQARKTFLKQQLNKVKQEELIQLLKCPICQGLYRFAHTLMGCGHTYCQICIFSYIKGYKGRNPDVKCPKCNQAIDPNYSKSIMKDVFKQSLVDIIEPKFAQQQAQIVQRVQNLFPQFDLETFMDQFKYQAYQATRKKVKKNEEKSPLMNLPEKIKQTLGLTFEKFAFMIHFESNYQQFKKIIAKKNTSNIIQIQPQNERAKKYVNMKNKMKINSDLTCSKLRRFLQKKVLQVANQTKQIAKQWILPDSDKLNIKVTLKIGSRVLKDEQLIEQIVKDNSGTIIYSIN